MFNIRLEVLAGIFVVLLHLSSAQYTTASCDGKTVIVHLFEWKWSDIAAECERFLAGKDFCAVQTSPPQEHLVLPLLGYHWGERYQVVSYHLNGRSGNESEFIDMVQRCNAVGVRIIVDAVLGHMTTNLIAETSGGSSYDGSTLDYPAVPYSSKDFTPRSLCPSTDGWIHDFNNPDEVRNCNLFGFADLYQASEYVRSKLVEYLNHLISIGVMGFRVNGAKHMWPEDLQIIEDRTNDLSTAAGFPERTRPLFYHQVIDYGLEPITVQEYYSLGRTTEFRYCYTIMTAMDNYSLLGGLYRPDWKMSDPDHALVFVDNHDTQRYGGSLSYKNGRDYSNAVVYTLAQEYGFTRIMSSFDFTDGAQPPPSNGEKINNVIINPDGTCGGGWVCEHRWLSISRMVQFRNDVGNAPKENWYLVNNTVAFSRGNKGFFAMNKDGVLDQIFQTGMSFGIYCDIITNCNKKVIVNLDGTARIIIDSYEDPFVAISRSSKLILPIFKIL